MKIKTLLALAVLSLSPTVAASGAGDVDAVIARHIEALGGRAAIDALDAAIELLREQAQTRSAKLRATV